MLSHFVVNFMSGTGLAIPATGLLYVNTFAKSTVKTLCEIIIKIKL